MSNVRGKNGQAPSLDRTGWMTTEQPDNRTFHVRPGHETNSSDTRNTGRGVLGDDFGSVPHYPDTPTSSRQSSSDRDARFPPFEGKGFPRISQSATSTTSYTSDSIPKESYRAPVVNRHTNDFRSTDPFHFDIDVLKTRSESSFESWEEESESKTSSSTLSTRATQTLNEGRGVQHEHHLALPNLSSRSSDLSVDFPDFLHHNGINNRRLTSKEPQYPFQGYQPQTDKDGWPIPLFFRPQSQKRQSASEESSSWTTFADETFQPIDTPRQPPKVPEATVTPAAQPSRISRRFFNRKGTASQMTIPKMQLHPRTLLKPTRDVRRSLKVEPTLPPVVSMNKTGEIQWMQVAPQSKHAASGVKEKDVLLRKDQQESIDVKQSRPERRSPSHTSTKTTEQRVSQPRAATGVRRTVKDTPPEESMSTDAKKHHSRSLHSSKPRDTTKLESLFQQKSRESSTNVGHAPASRTSMQSNAAALEDLMRKKAIAPSSDAIKTQPAKVAAAANDSKGETKSLHNSSILSAMLQKRNAPHVQKTVSLEATAGAVKGNGLAKPSPVVSAAVTLASQQSGSSPKVVPANSSDEPAVLTDDEIIRALHENPDFAKYSRMLKVGLPLAMVQNSMQRDGVHSALCSSPSVTVAPKRPSLPPDPIQRFRLHWQTHANVRSNTMWAMIGREAHWLGDVTVDEEEMTALFQKDKTVKTPVVSESGATSDSDSMGGAKVIDPKRANNCGIILARIKLTYRDIAMAIDAIDATPLTLEQIQGLAPFMPTDEEIRAFGTCLAAVPPGGPSPFRVECEKFMVELLRVDKAKAKIEAMSFMKRLPICVEELKSDSRLLQKACEETMNSSSLRKILSLVLHVGNVVNTSGTGAKQKATAIHLESLLTLHQSKAFDRKTSFLDYVARVLRRSHPTVVHQYRPELVSLARAAHVQWSDTVAELVALDDTLHDLKLMALTVRGGSGTASPDEETCLLQSSTLGRFVLEASHRMILVHAEMDAAQMVFDQLVHYFGEGNDAESTSPTSAPLILRHLAQFCTDLDAAVERAGAYETSKLRDLRRGVALRGGVAVSPSRVSPVVKARAKAKSGTSVSHPAKSETSVSNQTKSETALSNPPLQKTSKKGSIGPSFWTELRSTQR